MGATDNRRDLDRLADGIDTGTQGGHACRIGFAGFINPDGKLRILFEPQSHLDGT